MSRRTKGAGTIFERGNRWVVQIDLGIGHDGRRMRQSRIAPTRKDAEKLLRTMLNERDLGFTRANDNLTLQQIWMEWYEIGSQPVKKSTADQYLWRLEKWVSKKLAANNL